jgi:hypothetical protein
LDGDSDRKDAPRRTGQLLEEPTSPLFLKVLVGLAWPAVLTRIHVLGHRKSPTIEVPLLLWIQILRAFDIASARAGPFGRTVTVAPEMPQVSWLRLMIARF